MNKVIAWDYVKDTMGFVFIGATVWGMSLLSSGTLFDLV